MLPFKRGRLKGDVTLSLKGDVTLFPASAQKLVALCDQTSPEANDVVVSYFHLAFKFGCSLLQTCQAV